MVLAADVVPVAEGGAPLVDVLNLLTPGSLSKSEAIAAIVIPAAAGESTEISENSRTTERTKREIIESTSGSRLEERLASEIKVLSNASKC